MTTNNGHIEEEDFGTPLGSSMATPFNLVAGDIILGRISKIDAEYVYVSTGFKSESQIPLKEFRPDENGGIGYQVDEEIEVMVNHVGNERIDLSYANVAEKRRWENMRKAAEAGEMISGKIVAQVKGGYRVDIGLNKHAFMPGSHLGIQTKDGSEVVGQTFNMLIIEFKKGSDNVIVSHRDVRRKEMEAMASETFSRIAVDTVIQGTVTRLAKFGAFVDIGGIEGLVHVSEISHNRVAHPSNALNCGDIVKVKVLDVNAEQKRISLSIKQALPDPWDSINEMFKPEEVINGKVTKVLKFGAFVELREGYEGLLHISEIEKSDDKKTLAPGDEVKVKVVSADKESRRIKLALAQALPSKFPSEMRQYMDNGTKGVTLGDMLDGALDS